MIEDRAVREADVVTKLSRSVADAVARLTGMITAKGIASHHLTAGLAANLAGINALTDALVAS
jgi:hypothetical protein